MICNMHARAHPRGRTLDAIRSSPTLNTRPMKPSRRDNNRRARALEQCERNGSGGVWPSARTPHRRHTVRHTLILKTAQRGATRPEA